MKQVSSFMMMTLLVIAVIAFVPNALTAQEKNAEHGAGFVDENGDGFNDNAPDHDGDGIPNGRDEDYVGRGTGKGFVDEDGDGINDNAPDHDGDGIPNGQDPDYTGAQNRKANKNKGGVQGSAAENATNVQKGQGTGQCDGTGPKGPRGGGAGGTKRNR
jgi:hypothetical protein